MKIPKTIIAVMLMMVFAVVSVAAYDISWTCPISGTTAGTDVLNNMDKYDADAPFEGCNDRGNNFTVEFQITGTPAEWQHPGLGAGDINMSSTFNLKSGSTVVYTLSLDTNITNHSATTSELVRLTTFGTIESGKPSWVNLIPDGTYNWEVDINNNTDTSVAGVTAGDLFSAELGTAGNPAVVTFQSDDSLVLAAIGACEAGEECDPQLAEELGKSGGVSDKVVAGIVILMLGYWFFKRK